jgi:three-Cys-motif partner protein
MSSKLPILEIDDDGLPMRLAGDWTYDKLYYLNAYLARFIVSMRKKQWRAIHYIDLFAGPGKNRLSSGKIIPGSPLLALSQEQPFNHYYFTDLDPVYVDALKRRCSNHPEYAQISFLVGDANQVVDQIVSEVTNIDSIFTKGQWPSLNLAFLDPEGLELHWNTVEKLANRRTDLIIYYPQMGITRDAPREMESQPPTPIDRFFGDTNWRDLYRKYQNREETFLHRTLLDYYKLKLTALGYTDNHIVEPLLKNSKEVPLYRLLFACKHSLGNQFWADVTKDLPGGQMRLL